MRTRKRRTWTVAALTGLGVASISSSLSLAQDALGDGQVLDANSQVGSGGRNVGAPQADYRARNLLVTGNVAGGREFRGSVGYLAAEDFRGDDANSVIFNFDRATAFSSIPFISLGRTPTAIVTGQDMALLEIRRSTTAASLSSPDSLTGPFRNTLGAMLDARARLDQRLLSQESRNEYGLSLSQAETIGGGVTQGGDAIRISLSPAVGMRQSRWNADPAAYGLTPLDEARSNEDQLEERAIPTVGSPYQEDYSGYRVSDGRVVLTKADNRIDNSVSSDYSEMLGAAQKRYLDEAGGDLASATARVNDELTAIRDYLSGRVPDGNEAEGNEAEGNPTNVTQPDVVTPPGLEPPDLPLPPGLDSVPQLPEDLDVTLLRHDQTFESLTPEGSESRFAEIMMKGEERLRAGEYFLAEHEFVRALRYTPNHPMAMAGVMQAQVGAGVLSSAGSTLRRLFTRHPHMIDVQYGQSLLPPRERLLKLASLIRERVDADRGGSDSALFLAFIGRQLDDEDMMREGLDLMEGYDDRDPLTPLLRGVWLDVDHSDVPQDQLDDRLRSVEEK